MVCNAAGGLVPSLASKMKDAFRGAVILPSYGMTELVSILLWGYWWFDLFDRCMPITSPPTNYLLDRPGSSGIACGPHLSVRDPLDISTQLPCGKTGAICVRGTPTFEGYEVSSDISVPLDRSGFSREGWFDTGDVGCMDSDGWDFLPSQLRGAPTDSLLSFFVS
jgi:acyl-CoA synthetase (AMP-forming)/AMP-acid ligase II